MKLATKELVSLLTTPGRREFWMADLYRFRLKSGQDLRWASSDVNVKLSYRDIIVGSHPIAYFPLSGDVLDELPAAHDGRAYNLTYASDSPLNDGSEDQQCAVFNGADSVVEFDLYGGWFRVLRAFTYECWFKGDNSADGTHNQVLMGSNAGGFQFSWDQVGKGLNASAGSITNLEWIGAETIQTGASKLYPAGGVWYHLIATWDGVFLRLYTNGVLDNQSTETDLTLNPYDEYVKDNDVGHFRIGLGPEALSSTAWLAGRLAHVAVYPYCMPPEQVAYHYEARNGILFRADGPPMEREGVRETVGVEAADMEMTVFPRAEDMLPSIEESVGSTNLTIRKALANHYFDLADVTLYRAFACNVLWPTPSITADVNYAAHTKYNRNVSGGVVWINEDNALGEPDGSFAYQDLIQGDTTKPLMSFGHNFEVPADATITGVKATIRRRNVKIDPETEDVGSIFVMLVVNADRYDLGLPDPALIGVSQDDLFGPAWSVGSWEDKVYGGPNELWGATLTPEIVNDPGFGVAFNAHGSGGGTHPRQAQVDSILLEVFFDHDGTEYSHPSKYPGAVTSGNVIGHVPGTPDWINQSNVLVEDDTGTSITLAANQFGKALLVSNFGFEIPDGAEIKGLRMGVRLKTSGAGAYIWYANVHHDVTTLTYDGDTKGVLPYTNTDWETAWFGSVADDWGASLTPAIVSSENFGVSIQPRGFSSGPSVMEVDSIQVIVTYSLGGGTDGECVSYVNTSDLVNSGPFVKPPGALLRFAGIIGTVQVKPAQTDMTVRSKMILLNAPVPKNIIKPGCSWSLFDAGCGKRLTDETLYFQTAVGPGSTASILQLQSSPASSFSSTVAPTLRSQANYARKAYDYASGGGSQPWTSPENLGEFNTPSTVATCQVRNVTGENVSHPLLLFDYGFALPDDAVVEGVVVTYTRRLPGKSDDHNVWNYNLSSALWENCQNYESGSPVPIKIGNDKADWNGPDWWGGWEYKTHGNESDLWGTAGALTPELVNSEGFGFDIQVISADDSDNWRIPEVDAVRVTLYYRSASEDIAEGVEGQNTVGFFNLGHIKFLTGDMAGLQRSIKRQTGTYVELAQPFPFAPQVGETVRMWAGCDKTHTMCEQKFRNLQRFRGFPLITPADLQQGFAQVNA